MACKVNSTRMKLMCIRRCFIMSVRSFSPFSFTLPSPSPVLCAFSLVYDWTSRHAVTDRNCRDNRIWLNVNVSKMFKLLPTHYLLHAPIVEDVCVDTYTKRMSVK